MGQNDDSTTWAMIHAERVRTAEIMAGLTAEQWSTRSWCGDWTVQEVAGHIVAGAEQTKGRFFKGMVASGFRFNTMIDRDARAAGRSTPTELVDRLRATVGSTNGPPAPVLTMLGEVVVHGQDICGPLGITSHTAPEAVLACLELYQGANFPVGAKRRITGLQLHASDVDWVHGDGPDVRGTGLSLLSAITGRRPGLAGLAGDGVAELGSRMPARSS
ncbi:MAG: hypothetical protein JWL72_4217 [Ilumatobacteraceae bacterium]|nr:hypothetical protein [Ilumatobacteraceae bacterium]MCU1390879.1 hypothetical protein [Ilumatobacteraceae bacterium]